MVGALWDNRTKAAEVAAVIARLAQEKKLSSKIEKGELFLTHLAGLIGAIDYRRRLSNLGALSVQFVPAVLLILAVPAILLLRGAHFRLRPGSCSPASCSSHSRRYEAF